VAGAADGLFHVGKIRCAPNLSLGPDERDLALRLDAVSFRQRRSTLASAAAVQSCADLDLKGQNGTWALGQHPNRWTKQRGYR
jgi:hypothetical protein